MHLNLAFKTICRTTMTVTTAVGVMLPMSGCSSLSVRQTKRYRQRPYVYPATIDPDFSGFKPTQAILDEFPPLMTSGFLMPEPNCTVETCVFGPPICIGGLAAYILIDKPIAVVADTIMLPYDIHRVTRHNRIDRFWKRLSDKALVDDVTVDDLRYHYALPSGERYLRAYLSGEQVSRDVLLKMITAETGLSWIAASPHLDTDLARWLLETGAGTDQIKSALAKNPVTPDAILSELPPPYDDSIIRNQNASAGTLTPIADRTGNYRMLEIMARHPAVDAGLLHTIAGRLMALHPSSLPLIARHPRADETLLRQLADMDNIDVRQALAENPAVPDSVLVALLAEPDDRTARAVLRHPQASLPVKEKALRQIQHRMPGDWIRSGWLTRDREYGGIAFAAGSEIQFHRNGTVRSGILADDSLLNTPTLHNVIFQKGEPVSFNESGMVVSRILYPTTIQGMPCEQAQDHHRSGFPSAVVLAEEYEKNGIPFAPGTRIVFTSDGIIRHFKSPRAIAIQGIKCAPGKDVVLYESGRLKRAYIEAPHDISGISVPGGKWIELDESGKLPSTPPREHIDIAALFKRALTHSRQGRYKEALADYQRVYEINPTYSGVANNLAWLLATCPDDSLRDAKRAVTLASQEVERKRTWFTLDTLAAAYAEERQFRRAIKYQKKALELLRAQDEKTIDIYLADYQQRLELYRHKQPWRDPGGAP